MIRWFVPFAMLVASLPAPAAAEDARSRPVSDDIIYFVLPDRFENGDRSNDRGGLKGDRLATGYDPTAKGFYHGGDLAGLTRRLDYIEGLGATAIWFAPIFRNKPVQGPKGDESAGYHGYWVTDFTSVDPHFGSNAEFKAFVDAAHARGMKVYMDIITNHTADVIQYRDGDASSYRYRSLADYPFARRGGVDGPAINPGFAGDRDPSPDNWSKLVDPSFAYQPFVPKGEEHSKAPAWLNDPVYYHNRGNSDWVGESALYGDFAGLDDLATENPEVIKGFIEIYGRWIDEFGIDGFRIRNSGKPSSPRCRRVRGPAEFPISISSGKSTSTRSIPVRWRPIRIPPDFLRCSISPSPGPRSTRRAERRGPTNLPACSTATSSTRAARAPR